MKNAIIFFFLLTFVSIPAFAQKDRGIEPARKAYAKLVACKSDNVRKHLETINGLLTTAEYATVLNSTRDAVRNLAFDCMEKRYDPKQLVANINGNVKRSASIVKLVYFLEEMQIPVSNLTSLSAADQQAVTNARTQRDQMRQRLYMNSRMERSMSSRW